jgi:hypothetical protein
MILDALYVHAFQFIHYLPSLSSEQLEVCICTAGILRTHQHGMLNRVSRESGSKRRPNLLAKACLMPKPTGGNRTSSQSYQYTIITTS